MMQSNFSSMVNGFEYYDMGFLQNPIQDPSSSDFDHWIPTSTHDQDQEDHHYSVPHDEIDSQETILRYVNQLLMEESISEKHSMFYDSLALQQTEEMLQQVIKDSSSQSQSYLPNSMSSVSISSSRNSSVRTSSNESEVLCDDHIGDSSVVSSQTLNENLVRSMFSDAESVLQFKKGVEEANKFLPNTNQWIFNLKPERREVVSVKKEEKRLSGFSRTRQKEEEEEEEEDLEETRSSKQFAESVVEDREELTELFDKVLLLDCKSNPQIIENGENDSRKVLQDDKKKKKKKSNQAIDFRTLLTLCAQSVSAGDKITSDDLLKQIRKQCSPLGDASERLAHFFANALEARLQGSSGTTIQSYYDSITSRKRSTEQILKSYRAFLSSSPFMTLIFFFNNKLILDAAKDASVLHIIDFGILYGFQWPMFIQHLSQIKSRGPRKLRITGIELPQHGFRPTERIKDTGKRLAEYCKRFGVPFEYNAIASKNWETIRIEEFKIRPNEVLAVNTVSRLKNLRDVTPGEEDCPRDGFLRLIRALNPDVFLTSTINGSFNAPFFTTRFKEALFHYSALFDMFDSTLSRENPERIHFEREFFGREVMNVIACEGVERVERPESYKQWQVRMIRAGFKQKPVETELVERFREKMKRWGYHKDFVIDEDCNWFLQGWKGRILFSSSCWLTS